jgi:hypothetical protein
MNPDVDISGYMPQVMVGRDNGQFIIRCEIVDHQTAGPQRSGKYVHLGLTPEDAMRLLALLRSAQAKLSLPDHPLAVGSLEVPATKDRH